MPILIYRYNIGEISFGEILKRYGHLGQNELELFSPRYRERPELLQMLQITDDPRYNLRKAYISSREMEKQIVKKYPELKNEINTARRYLTLREKVKFEFLRGYDILRFMLRKIETKIEWPKDLIFFLKPEEIIRIKEITVSKIKERKSHWEIEQNLNIPPIIDTGLDFQVVLEKSTTILTGIGATDEISEGEVVVILNIDDCQTVRLLKPGKILVTKFTAPAWTPFMAAVKPGGGIITEIGGMLAHAAIIARELGIAAVVNVSGATTMLKTGMKIKIDGRKGKVEILE